MRIINTIIKFFTYNPEENPLFKSREALILGSDYVNSDILNFNGNILDTRKEPEREIQRRFISNPSPNKE